MEYVEEPRLGPRGLSPEQDAAWDADFLALVNYLERKRKMNVRAKFKVDAIKTTLSNKEKLFTIKLSPVYGNNDPDHENTKFYRWTPSGSINLSVVREETANAFELGKEYYIDFTPSS